MNKKRNSDFNLLDINLINRKKEQKAQKENQREIKNNTNLPETKCEVCGNEINQRSLNFYKNKNRNSKIKK